MEILFRGFHECEDGQTVIIVNGEKKCGKWVYGAYFEMVHTDKRHSHHFIIPIGCDLSKGRKIEDIQVEVIPETVGQYTGLTDKNGKKIFEGDIVTDKKAKNIGVITSGVYEECSEYYADHNGYYVKWTDNSFKPQLNFWCRQKYIEVIGNIFNNPELLK